MGSPCVISFTDKRRPPTKSEIQELRNRVRVLEGQIRNSRRSDSSDGRESNAESNQPSNGGDGQEQCAINISSIALHDLAMIYSEEHKTSISSNQAMFEEKGRIVSLANFYSEEISSYWQWQADHFDIVNQNTFEVSITQTRLGLINESEREAPLRLLLLCMAALGSLHFSRWQRQSPQHQPSRSANVKPLHIRQSLARTLMDLTQSELFVEQKNPPNIFTLQALALCVIWALGQGETGHGRMLNAMMVSQYERLVAYDKTKEESAAQVTLLETIPRIDG